MAYKHAELMKQYAEDAANYDKPWQQWEYDNSGYFISCTQHPVWDIHTEYRRKPQIILINGHGVPKPLGERPLNGRIYYYPYFGGSQLYDSYTWRGDSVDNNLFCSGICHLTKEAAIAHAKALLSLTKREV